MAFLSLALDSRVIREACGRPPDADQTGFDVGLYLPCYLVQDAPHRRVLCAVIELTIRRLLTAQHNTHGSLLLKCNVRVSGVCRSPGWDLVDRRLAGDDTQKATLSSSCCNGNRAFTWVSAGSQPGTGSSGHLGVIEGTPPVVYMVCCEHVQATTTASLLPDGDLYRKSLPSPTGKP